MPTTTTALRGDGTFGEVDPSYLALVAGAGCRPTDLTASLREWEFARDGIAADADERSLASGRVLADRTDWLDAVGAVLAAVEPTVPLISSVGLLRGPDRQGWVWSDACAAVAAAQLAGPASSPPEPILAGTYVALVEGVVAEHLLTRASRPSGALVAEGLRRRRAHRIAVSSSMVWFHRVAFATTVDGRPGPAEAAWLRQACNVTWSDDEVALRWDRVLEDIVEVGAQVLAEHLLAQFGQPSAALGCLASAAAPNRDPAVGRSLLLQAAHWARERRATLVP